MNASPIQLASCRSIELGLEQKVFAPKPRATLRPGTLCVDCGPRRRRRRRRLVLAENKLRLGATDDDLRQEESALPAACFLLEVDGSRLEFRGAV